MALQNVGNILFLLLAAFMSTTLLKYPPTGIDAFFVLLASGYIVMVGFVSFREKGILYNRRGMWDLLANIFTIVTALLALVAFIAYFAFLLLGVDFIAQLLGFSLAGVDYKNLLLLFALLGIGPALVGVATK